MRRRKTVALWVLLMMKMDDDEEEEYMSQLVFCLLCKKDMFPKKESPLFCLISASNGDGYRTLKLILYGSHAVFHYQPCPSFWKPSIASCCPHTVLPCVLLALLPLMLLGRPTLALPLDPLTKSQAVWWLIVMFQLLFLGSLNSSIQAPPSLTDLSLYHQYCATVHCLHPDPAQATTPTCIVCGDTHPYESKDLVLSWDRCVVPMLSLMAGVYLILQS